MLMELAFSLKSVYHFIDEISDNDVNESHKSTATPSPPSTLPVPQVSETSKEKKKKKKREIFQYLQTQTFIRVLYTRD